MRRNRYCAYIIVHNSQKLISVFVKYEIKYKFLRKMYVIKKIKKIKGKLSCFDNINDILTNSSRK